MLRALSVACLLLFGSPLLGMEAPPPLSEEQSLEAVEELAQELEETVSLAEESEQEISIDAESSIDVAEEELPRTWTIRSDSRGPSHRENSRIASQNSNKTNDFATMTRRLITGPFEFTLDRKTKDRV